MSRQAGRRRRTFESVENAFERFREKQVFSQWSDDVLRLYVEHGTVEQDDGQRTLVWSPEWESFYYSTPYIDIWQRLPEFDALKIPTLIITGETSDIYTPESRRTLRNLVPSATYHTIAGHGHLFPHSAPQKTAQLMREWLDTL